MKELIKDLENKLKEYQILIEQYEKHETLNYEDTEYYGAYLGKAEMLEYVIEKLKTI